MVLRMLDLNIFGYALFNPLVTVYELFMESNVSNTIILVLNVIFILTGSGYAIFKGCKRMAAGI